MRVLAEECYSSSRFLAVTVDTISPHSHTLLLRSLSPCRPYFELKAKYYLQLEVREISQRF